MADYARLKVTELREMMRERGVSAAGLTRKQQYVDALVANDEVSTTDVERAMSEGHTEGSMGIEEDQATTGKGQAVLETEDAVPEDEAVQAQEEEEADKRKRKRRSPTPVLSDESLKKRLKVADDAVKLPEDNPDNSHPNTPTASAANSKSATDNGKSDIDNGNGDTDNSKNETDNGKNGAENISTDTDNNNDNNDNDPAPIGPPSLHPPTRALYIKNLIRPLHVPSLRDHLITLSISDIPPTIFHLDFLRTHAFVVFPTVTAAANARAGLHGHVWPEEPSRKTLWIDFVPEASVPQWVEIEGVGKREGKRWELVYEERTSAGAGAGVMEVKLREVQGTGAGAGAGGRRASSFGDGAPLIRRSSSNPGQEVAGGHKDDAWHEPEQRQLQFRPSPPPPTNKKQHDRDHSPFPSPASQQTPLTTDPTTNKPTNTTFSLLDTRYPSTQHAKPRLYFKPQSEDVVHARLRALDRATSRDWAARRRGGRDVGQWRRYTFEAGRVVDGGPDRGNFGMVEMGGAGGGGGGYYGRRGGRSNRGWLTRF